MCNNNNIIRSLIGKYVLEAEQDLSINAQDDAGKCRYFQKVLFYNENFS